MGVITFKSSELKNKIEVELSSTVFIKDGFTYRKSDNSFICKEGDNLDIFNMELLFWGGHFTLDVELYISQKKVEAIYKKILDKSDDNTTMGNNIGRIYSSSDGRQVVASSYGNLTIRIRQNEDIEAAVESLTWYYRDIAKPYFQRYKKLEAIDDIFNSPPFENLPAHAQINLDKKCMKGLIIAKLIDNPRYNELVAIYDKQINELKNEESLVNYVRVKDYLNNL